MNDLEQFMNTQSNESFTNESLQQEQELQQGLDQEQFQELGQEQEKRVIAFILINTEHDKTRLVAKKLLKIPEVLEVHEVYGQYDIIIKIQLPTLAKLKDLLYNKIRMTEGVLKTETLLTI